MKKILFYIAIAILLSSCVTESAMQINKCYWIVGDHVENWREWHDPIFKKDKITKSILENSDTASFEILENPFSTTCYAKDKNNVYMNFSIIEGADPATFEFIGEFYMRDKSHVFHSTKMLKEANPKTFVVFNFGNDSTQTVRTVADAKDDKNIYNNGWLKSFSDRVDVTTFFPLSPYFFRDKDKVYRSEDTGKPIDENIFEIPDADISSFQILPYSDGFYAKDSSHIYLNAYGYKFVEFVPEDLETFEILNVRYTKDNKNVYYYGEILNGADPESFEKDSNHSGIDKNGKWTPNGELEKE